MDFTGRPRRPLAAQRTSTSWRRLSVCRVPTHRDAFGWALISRSRIATHLAVEALAQIPALAASLGSTTCQELPGMQSQGAA